MNDLLEKKARAIALNMSKKGVEPTYCFDILIIIALASLIIGAIRLIMECNRDKQEQMEFLQNPGILGKIRLRRLIKQNGLKHEPEVLAALAEEAKLITTDEYDKLVAVSQPSKA